MPTKLAHNIENFAQWIVDLLLAKEPDATIVKLVEEAKKAYQDYYPKSILDLSDFEALVQAINKNIPSMDASYAPYVNGTSSIVIQLQLFQICLESMKAKKAWISYLPYDFLLFRLVEKIKELNPGKKNYQKETMAELYVSFSELLLLLQEQIKTKITNLSQQTSKKYQEQIDSEAKQRKLEEQQKARLDKVQLFLSSEEEWAVKVRENPDKYIIELRLSEMAVKKFKTVHGIAKQQKNVSAQLEDTKEVREQLPILEQGATENVSQIVKEIKIELNWHTPFGVYKIELARYSPSLAKIIKDLYAKPEVILSRPDIKEELHYVIGEVLQTIQYKINPSKSDTFRNTYVFYLSENIEEAQLFWWDNLGNSLEISLEKYPFLSQFFNKPQALTENDPEFKLALMQISLEKVSKLEKPKPTVFGLQSLMASRAAILLKDKSQTTEEALSKEIQVAEKIEEEPPLLVSRSLNQDKAKIVSYVLAKKQNSTDESTIDAWDLFVKKANILRKIDLGNPLINDDIKKLISLEKDEDKNKQAIWELKKSLVEKLKTLPEKEYDHVFYTEEMPILFENYPIYSYIFSWDDKEKETALYFVDQFRQAQLINVKDLDGLMQFQASLKTLFLPTINQEKRDQIFLEQKKHLETLLDNFKLRSNVIENGQTSASQGFFKKVAINLILANELPELSKIKLGHYVLTKQDNEWVLYCKFLKKLVAVPLKNAVWKEVNNFLQGFALPEGLKRQEKQLKSLIKAALSKPQAKEQEEIKEKPKKKSVVSAAFLEAQAILAKLKEEGGLAPNP